MSNLESALYEATSSASVRRTLRFIMENFAEDLCLEDLATAASITKFNLCRNFQKQFGLTPMKWLWSFRALLAAEFIRLAPTWSLTDIAFTCGFTSSAHFSRSFQQVIGMAPSKYRKRVLDGDESVAVDRVVDGYSAVYQDNMGAVSAAFNRMMTPKEES